MIVRLKGGLGNQMFQYAMAKQLASYNNWDIYYDLCELENDKYRKFVLDKFAIEINICEEDDQLSRQRKVCDLHYKTRIFRWLEKNCGVIIEKKDFLFSKLKIDGYYDGYWQNIHYFSAIIDDLRKDFSFYENLNLNQKRYLQEICQNNSIALHIRRGDYLTPYNRTIYYNLDNVYYQNAIDYICSRVNQGVIYVFSDDIEWCKKNLVYLENAHFVDDKISQNEFVDFEFMKNCKYFIIANSTFSWWASELSDFKKKIVVAPDKWFVDNEFNDNVKRALLLDCVLL